ncbi:16S rRNA (guanine(527)-N(7))-methyltransferase RsmG [Paracoccus sp. (in: a-proteobacteria)]|uniref:16S rRNA (guanine(527)-N(7))-methyltransferase RsmG n=1 Tax=Paracoccus sp. TaxID=267 RepID=UPI0026E03B0B|nr:16S rRNA (guanine(527)-N(7))-methyltransferase RsmG [Paracoccus sp. (in: a-proteobacteria)]MDO5368782.1 16S rRNA (guanine(527)-N(7))-methyltransferase RsmG [Paracoccus sp. (in: a-proteobacteria)]
MNASREAKLVQYAELVRRWNPRINLVARTTIEDIETRHIRDSLQLNDLVSPSAGTWMDIGSGGGLPGLVLAICRPQTSFRLVDSDSRKVVFLQTVIRELSLPNCTAQAARIENLSPAKALTLSARALAPLERLMPYLARHLAPEGTAWLMKGRNWQTELAPTQESWNFELKIHPSKTDEDAAILQIWNVKHV